MAKNGWGTLLFTGLLFIATWRGEHLCRCTRMSKRMQFDFVLADTTPLHKENINALSSIRCQSRLQALALETAME